MMVQNKNPKSQKKNGCLKIILIFIGVLFLLAIIGKLTTMESNSKKTENNPLIEKLEKVYYSGLKQEEKKQIMNYFIQGEYQFSSKNFLLNQNINNAIEKSLKFPETLQILGFDNEYHKDYETNTSIQNDATNINYENGTFEVIRKFKAEGNISGVEIRKIAIFKFKFNHSTVSIESVKIE